MSTRLTKEPLAWVVIDTKHDLGYFFPTRALARHATNTWNETAKRKRYTYRRNVEGATTPK